MALTWRCVAFGVLFGAMGCGDDGTILVDDAATLDGTASSPCQSDSDCDDGTFCNGQETCDADHEDADANGCVSGEPPCADGQGCSETDEACDGECAEPDADGDGRDSIECGGDDCDDDDPNRYPGNSEVCDTDGHDEDCDDSTFGVRDLDSDGHIDIACCNTTADGQTCGTDCDDMRAVVNPVATEACDTFDNDCDGEVDEGVLQTFYEDADGDSFGSSADDAATVLGCSVPTGYSDIATDCDDTVASTNPAADEVCDMGSAEDPANDEDCDGSVNEMCACPNGGTQACAAQGVCAMGMQECINGVWSLCSVSPLPEICDGLDNDCNGEVDNGVQVVFHRDMDGDGHGDPDVTMMACPGEMEGWVRFLTMDCDDSSADRNPAQLEDCDDAMVDENCDGEANEGCDCADGATRACPQPGECGTGEQTCSGGAWGACSVPVQTESCDGLDNDCDGGTDEGLEVTFYQDMDGDGHGDPAVSMEACPGIMSGWVAFVNDDCDDSADNVHPDHNEVCDGIDNDCSEGGGAQSGEDDDEDGYADESSTCIAAGGTLPKSDCNDSNSNVRPGAPAQEAPLCTGVLANSCGSSTTGFGCRLFPGGGCDIGTGDWDYNCDGVHQAEGTCLGMLCSLTCTWTGTLPFRFCRGANSIRAEPGPECGFTTDEQVCDAATCTWIDTGNTTTVRCF